jgi:hypothetical protein
MATWSQSAATRYVSGYGVYMATPVAVRNVFEDLARWGNEWTISWQRGQAKAEWVHVRPDESIERFDTGLKEYGPLIIETPTTRRHELHWLAPLGVGEKAVAVSPAGDGHVLVGELQRLE